MNNKNIDTVYHISLVFCKTSFYNNSLFKTQDHCPQKQLLIMKVTFSSMAHKNTLNP